MLRIFLITLYTFVFSAVSYAQQDPSEQVNELISAEYNMSVLAKNRGIFTAYKTYSDEYTTFFVPAPTNALSYLNGKPKLPDVITWKPIYAKVSKSNEWGFTTGPIHWQSVGYSKKFGEYLCLWKRDRKGEWKIAYRAISEHGQPTGDVNTIFESPINNKFRKLRSKARIKQREDIIFSTDQLFSTILKADNLTAFNEFLAEGARTYIPAYNPVVGLEKIKSFLKKQEITIESSTVEKVDRTYSGELAYSSGEAIIRQGNEQINCHYIRIWEVQEDAKWKVVVDMYFKK